MPSLSCTSTFAQQPVRDLYAIHAPALSRTGIREQKRQLTSAVVYQQRRSGSARWAVTVHASAQQQLQLGSLKASNDSRAAELKAEISKLAGGANGTDLSPAEHEALKGVISELEALNPAQPLSGVDLTGTKWQLVYTTSTAASSGKIGPFVGYVEQEFPVNQPTQYINWVSFAGGLVKAKLLADYTAGEGRDNKLEVTFIDTTLMLGPLQFTKAFEANRGGWWRLTYIDSDWRILYANTGNVFVLAR